MSTRSGSDTICRYDGVKKGQHAPPIVKIEGLPGGDIYMCCRCAGVDTAHLPTVGPLKVQGWAR